MAPAGLGGVSAPKAHYCGDCGGCDEINGGGGGHGHSGSEFEAVWFCERCWRRWSDSEAQVAALQKVKQDREAALFWLSELPPRLLPLLELARERLTLISLGTWCGVKMAVRALALEPGGSLPFDWVRISVEGVRSALLKDFEGFLNCNRTEDITREPGAGRRYIVGASHVFHHDDPSNTLRRARFLSRIDRFRTLAVVGQMPAFVRLPPLVFVRALASTFELFSVASLLVLLTERFGAAHEVWLLLLLDRQPADAIFVFEDCPRLILHTLSYTHCIREGISSRLYHLPLASMVARLSAVGVGSSTTGCNTVSDRTTALAGLPDLGDGEAVSILPSVAELLAPAAGGGGDVVGRAGRLKHASLGEDLVQVMTPEPLLPPCGELRGATALGGRDAVRLGVAWAAAKAHLHALRSAGLLVLGDAETGLPEEPMARASGLLCVAAAVLARQLLSLRARSYGVAEPNTTWQSID